MSVTQPPPSSLFGRRSRIPLKTLFTTFLRRRKQRGASAVLPCRGFLGFVRRFRRFSSSAPFCFSSLVAARRLFDFVVIISAQLSAFFSVCGTDASFASPFRFDIPSFRRVFASEIRRSAYFASRFRRRRSVWLGTFLGRQARRGAVVLGSGAPSNLGEIPT